MQNKILEILNKNLPEYKISELEKREVIKQIKSTYPKIAEEIVEEIRKEVVEIIIRNDKNNTQFNEEDIINLLTINK